MVIDLSPLWKLFSRILQVDWLEYGRRVLNTHDSRGPRSVGVYVIDWKHVRNITRNLNYFDVDE